MSRARSTDSDHDRRGRRALYASPARYPPGGGYLDWPGAAQVFRADRRILDTEYPCTGGGGEIRTEIVTGATSLSPDRADASALLRGHWSIEKPLHTVGLSSLRSHLRRGPFPRWVARAGGAISQVMAALRNTAIGLLRLANFPSTAATRRQAALPWQALSLLGCPRARFDHAAIRLHTAAGDSSGYSLADGEARHGSAASEEYSAAHCHHFRIDMP